MIGVIGAMDQEVARLRADMESPRVREYASMTFYSGKLCGADVVVVRSGVGKVNAAVCTQILADIYHVDAVINTGVAGSLNPAIDIGDIVVSVDAVYHDVHAEVWGYEPGEVPQLGQVFFPADERLGEIIRDVCRQVNSGIGVHAGRIASGDQFVSDDGVKKRIADVFHADCAEMEGCAIAQTAWLNRIPFVIIRAISDKADGSARMDYDEFEAKAIENSVRLVEAAVPRIDI